MDKTYKVQQHIIVYMWIVKYLYIQEAIENIVLCIYKAWVREYYLINENWKKV